MGEIYLVIDYNIFIHNLLKFFKMKFHMIIASFIGKQLTIELKNDLIILGTLYSVDQFLNIKLTGSVAKDPEKYPHLTSTCNCFVRGSAVRYIQLPPDCVDLDYLHKATSGSIEVSK